MTDLPESALPPAWQAALTHSRYLRQLLEARPEVAIWLNGNASRAADSRLMSAFLSSETPASDDELKRNLRRLRQRVMAALIVRDIGGQAPLAEVMETMTQLADITTNLALDFLHRQLVAQFGEPLDSQGRPQRLLVVGMGKLG